MKSKHRLYFLSSLTLTLLLTGLRTACFLTSYETNVGYLANTPTVFITRLMYILATAWCLAAPLLLPNDTTLQATSGIAQSICTTSAGALLLFSGICLLIGSLAKAPSIFSFAPVLRPILGISASLSSIFFFAGGSTSSKKKKPHTAFGFALLIFLFALLLYSYFNMYVAINSPIKNALQLSILCAMIFTLCEIRESIGRPRLRISPAVKLLCALFCLPTAISHLIFERSSLCSALEKDLLSPFFALALLSIGIFALATFPLKKEMEKSEKKSPKPLDKTKEA